MKTHLSTVRPLPVLLGVLGFLLLSGCATSVQPFTVSAQHPANPQAASGAPAADLLLLAPAVPAAADKPAESEMTPAHTHKHDS